MKDAMTSGAGDESPGDRSGLCACVAVGASALGLQSLCALFAAMPADTGAAFVVAVREEDSPLPSSVVDQLAAVTAMPVRLGQEGNRLVANHVYVANGGLMTVQAGQIRLSPSDRSGPDKGAVDSLLVSTAESYEEEAIIVVLSGLGHDGATGMAAAKRFGGFGLAQAAEGGAEPEAHAITAAGIADLCLPVERLPGEIVAYVRTLNATGEAEGAVQALQDDVGQSLARVAAILRNATGNDFQGYKHATFLRRVQRRMQVTHTPQIGAYIERLRSDPGEVQHLFQDLLIGVTQFFRDPLEFEVLARDVIHRLFEGRGGADRIRVWVLGCATGEEAYSIAILMREHMARLDTAPHVQIFATDIDARALAVARGGRYPDSIARHISAQRLARWFVREGATCAVVKELREMCIFSPHNLIKDAPFSRIDLLSCRNLLIYLNADLQDRVMPIFHFALKPGGYLFLGPAENVTRHQKLFAAIDRKNRIFRRLETASRVFPDFPLSPRTERLEGGGELAVRAAPPTALGGRLGRRLEQLTERYAPAYVVVDESHEVLHFSGRTGRFLDPASGAATLNLFSLVHRDLRLDLRGALQKATADRRKVEARAVPVGDNGASRSVNIIVEPLSLNSDEPRTLAILFQDAGPISDPHPSEHSDLGVDEHVARLEAELRLTRERLQTTIEELESTNEELKSSNEEYQSINEELQSANEELETSKEELQSVNEELQTVNGELAHRVADLGRTNSDLKNLLESTQIATLFLDNDLRLRNFTPASSEVFHLIETDVGRPIAHIAPRVNYPQMQDDARKVLKTLGQIERELASTEGDRQFLTRVLPYRSVDNFIAGVVLTFLEITGTARAEAALRASERRFGEAQQLAGVGVWEWHLDTGQTWWSPVVYHLWGLPLADQPPAEDALPIHPEDRDAYRQAFAQAVGSGEISMEWRVNAASGQVRWLALAGRLERNDGGRRMLGVVQDVTERKQTETRLKLLLGELQHRVRNILAVIRSIVARTVRSAGSVEELASHLDGRLDTLARTQAVFTRSAEATLDLEDMARDEMLAVAAREEQVTIDGPPVRLRREAAETFALALHELTTNAVKYGALARLDGKVAVTWRLVNTSVGPRLSLEWRESGVPAIDIAPARSGFGRDLIERGLPYELGAATALEFGHGGVRALIELPLNDRVAVLD
jgi:two-component system CheB/CheR fusion protein